MAKDVEDMPKLDGDVGSMNAIKSDPDLLKKKMAEYDATHGEQ